MDIELNNAKNQLEKDLNPEGSIGQKYIQKEKVFSDMDAKKIGIKVVKFGGSSLASAGQFEKVGNRLEKIPQTLEEDKMYYVMFIVKNRFGKANDQQIVYEIDMQYNKVKEIGYTRIVDDSFN